MAKQKQNKNKNINSKSIQTKQNNRYQPRNYAFLDRGLGATATDLKKAGLSPKEISKIINTQNAQVAKITAKDQTIARDRNNQMSANERKRMQHEVKLQKIKNRKLAGISKIILSSTTGLTEAATPLAAIITSNNLVNAGTSNETPKNNITDDPGDDYRAPDHFRY